MRLTILCPALLLAACGSSSMLTSGEGTPGMPYAPSGSAEGGGTDASLAGVLTAGVWDDNLNYDYFKSFQENAAKVQGAPGFTAQEQDDAERLSGARTPATSLDIALVIDTTGSMGDEIQYLKAEFADLAGKLGQLYPSVPQRWALIAYRDTGDIYVVAASDFDAAARQEKTLSGFEAGGGGDYPESPDAALAHAAQLSWSKAAGAAHLLFWVADAPHHAERAAAMSDAIHALQRGGVHIYPVSASGVDQLLEYTMRASAQLTLGRYLFLTDDSGVGNTHKEPEIPCYWVTRLNHAMTRVIRSEVEGTIVEIDPAQVIRSSGSPKDGKCGNTGTVSYIF